MTVASEITRLQNAKASIRSSIQEKWVTVPSSAKLDTYSWYIDQIQTWWAAGIVGNKVVRAGTYAVWRYQTISTEVIWLSYVTWDYMFLPSLFKRWRDDNWTLIVSMCVVYTPTWVDYVQSSREDSDSTSSWHPDKRLAWVKISESGNIVTFETTYWRYGNEYFPENWKYYYHATWTFNKSTNTFGNWTLYVTQQTTEEPERWFEWLVWDQWYYTLSMERLWPGDNVWIEKWTPTFS